MAISPMVNSYMQEAEQPPQSAEQIFAQQFIDQAYNTLRAKFPALLNCVVTLKILQADLDKDSVFGVFILQAGKDLVYLPVVMSGGVITSCEMGYNKQEDQFFPLNDAAVKNIVAASSYSDPTLLTKNPHVEDTRALFRNMIRPPTSSNVVLAGVRGGLASLPNQYKTMLSDWLEKEHPEVLGKIASFYAVEDLAQKLALQPEIVKTAENEDDAFLRLENLEQTTAQSLSPTERETMLKQGWLLKTGTQSDALLVTAEEALPKMIEQELQLQTYVNPQKPDYSQIRLCNQPWSVSAYPVCKADLVQGTAQGLAFKPALLCGRNIIVDTEHQQKLSCGQSVLVAHLQNECKFEEIQQHNSFVSIARLQTEFGKWREKYHCERWLGLLLVVPTRKQTCLALDTSEDFFSFAEDWKVASNGDEDIITCNTRNLSIVVSPQLQKGYLQLDFRLIVPKTTLFFIVHNSAETALSYLSSFDVLHKMLSSLGTHLTVTDNGAGTSITDKSTQKTASFAQEAEAASWLHNTYGLNSPQIRTVLDNKNSVVFNKKAFIETGAMPQYLPQYQMPQVPVDAQAPYAPQQATAQETPLQGEAPVPQPYDPTMLNDFAELEDPDMFDADVLASFASYPDIKDLLVDYLPDFLAAQDKVGRILLLFSSQKKEIEDFYGTEKCSNLLSSCRRIFNILGELVTSLKLYVHMA